MTSRAGDPGELHIERAYDDPVPGRYRVLVDRLWPRGVTKERAALDRWAKDVAPSTVLRRWYGHDPDRFEHFARRYRDELAGDPAAAALAELREAGDGRALALVTATRDLERSGAQVLYEVLTTPTSSGADD